jgi:hypothetical protein
VVVGAGNALNVCCRILAAHHERIYPMAPPGPCDSAHRGGFHFARPVPHGGRQQLSPSPTGRYTAALPRGRFISQQRFAFTPLEDGGARVTLNESEEAVLHHDQNGNLVIDIAPAASEAPAGEPAPAVEVEIQVGQVAYRGHRRRDKMMVDHHDDGTLSITPAPGNVLLTGGDPESGMLEIIEVEPAQVPT